MFDHHKLLLFAGCLMVVCLLVVLAIMLDLCDGVRTAKVTGERVHSHKFRVTIWKVWEYWGFILIGFLIDCIGCIFDFYLIPYVAITFGTGLILVEAKSMFEHARLRKSKAAGLQKMLKGIIDASTEKDAREIMKKIAALLES